MGEKGSINTGNPTRADMAEQRSRLGGTPEVPHIVDVVRRRRDSGKDAVVAYGESQVDAAEREALKGGSFHAGGPGTLLFLRNRSANQAGQIERLNKAQSEAESEVRSNAELSDVGKTRALAKIGTEFDEKRAAAFAEAAHFAQDLAQAYGDNLRKHLGELLREHSGVPLDERRRDADAFHHATSGFSPELLVQAFTEFGIGEPWAGDALPGVALRLLADPTADTWTRLKLAINRSAEARASAILSGSDERSSAIRETSLRLVLLDEARVECERSLKFLAQHPADADLITTNRAEPEPESGEEQP